MGYIRTARNVAAREVRRLEERVVLVGGKLASSSDEVVPAALPPAKKIRFMDDPEEREAALADEQLHEEASDTNGDLDFSDEEGSETSSDNGKSPLDELSQQLQRARERLKALADAEDALELQQARMAKTATVGGVTKKGKVFKVRQRKR
jgi:U3 small nucleolar RNA-associated protein 11